MPRLHRLAHLIYSCVFTWAADCQMSTTAMG